MSAQLVMLPMTTLTGKDIELDRLWREVFGQPLPMLGAPDIAKAILDQHRKSEAEAA